MLKEIKLRFTFYWNGLRKKQPLYRTMVEDHLDLLLKLMATALETFSQGSNTATLSIDLHPKTKIMVPPKMLICVRFSFTSPRPACQALQLINQDGTIMADQIRLHAQALGDFIYGPRD
ncbi:MAG: hypothetical protein Q9160_004945 [Pyrenula sp. 1 TL-2023]